MTNTKLNQNYLPILILAALLVVSYFVMTPLNAEAAFNEITVGGGVDETGTTDGLYKDMNTILTVILSIAGFVVVAALIFAGVKIATAQGNPQARTQGFVGLGVAFVGGWIVYKSLTVAGWIKGFGADSGLILPNLTDFINML